MADQYDRQAQDAHEVYHCGGRGAGGTPHPPPEHDCNYRQKYAVGIQYNPQDEVNQGSLCFVHSHSPGISQGVHHHVSLGTDPGAEQRKVHSDEQNTVCRTKVVNIIKELVMSKNPTEGGQEHIFSCLE